MERDNFYHNGLLFSKRTDEYFTKKSSNQTERFSISKISRVHDLWQNHKPFDEKDSHSHGHRFSQFTTQEKTA